MGPDQLFSDGLEKRFGAGGTRLASTQIGRRLREEPGFLLSPVAHQDKGRPIKRMAEFGILHQCDLSALEGGRL